MLDFRFLQLSYSPLKMPKSKSHFVQIDDYRPFKSKMTKKDQRDHDKPIKTAQTRFSKVNSN